MSIRQGLRGITVVEVLVVLFICLVLASFLFPVFAKPREKARNTTCLSQVRQMATACQMFNQDSGAHYPGKNWVNDINVYLGNSQKIFWCDQDTSGEDDSAVSYGYSGLLLGANGSGVAEAQIKNPPEVGVICDATPSKTYPTGGIVGGGALLAVEDYAVLPAARHSNGTCVGYADGHAKYIPDGINVKDTANGVTRAFYMAPALGLVDNGAGGVAAFPSPVSHNATPLVFDGDYCVSPIILAAGEVWKQIAGAKYSAKGFLGAYCPDKKPRKHYLRGRADNRPGGPNSIPVARDCLVFIVAKNTKIPVAVLGNIVHGNYVTTPANLHTIFVSNAGYAGNQYQAYDYDQYSGNRAYASAPNVLNGTPGKGCLTVKDDLDMVDKVANDPLAIGYCSSAMADPEHVTILGIAIGNTTYYYPNMSSKFPTIFPDLPTWPFTRTLYVDAGGKATGADSISQVMLKGAGFEAIKSGPLFQASYFVP